MLSKKSPRGSCGIGKRNNRIGRTGSLNQRCALAPDLESILRGRTRKILFRQHRSFAERLSARTSCPLLGRELTSSPHASTAHLGQFRTQAPQPKSAELECPPKRICEESICLSSRGPS